MPYRRVSTPHNFLLRQIHTPEGRFKCRRLVVTAGAWINHVLGSLGVHIPVKVTQEQVTYFSTPNIKDFTEQKYLFDIISVPQLYHNEVNKVGPIHRYKTCQGSSAEKINSRPHPINSYHLVKGSVLLKDNKSFGL